MADGKADTSCKFGAGRYLQGRGVLEQAGSEILRYGRKPYIVGGPTALSVVRQRLDTGLATAGITACTHVHPGAASHEAARIHAASARSDGCDVVVGVGGGRIMDFAKLVADELGTRVVNIPTSAATCAAYTPFSLLYTPEGRTIPGNYCYDLEVAAVLVDLDIMAGQPVRCLVAGMLDAMAKYYELKNGQQDQRLDPMLSLAAATHMAQLTCDKLSTLAFQVCQDVATGRISPTLEDVVRINIPFTGMISALSGGVGQSAIAHALYYQARLLFPRASSDALHGEIVGLGLLMQLHYNGMTEQVAPLMDFLVKLRAPTCLSQIGIQPDPDNCRLLCQAIMASRHVARTAAAQEAFQEAFALIAR